MFISDRFDKHEKALEDATGGQESLNALKFLWLAQLLFHHFQKIIIAIMNPSGNLKLK